MSEAPGGPKERFVQLVVARAVADERFRSRLLADPVAAIEEEWEVKVPTGFGIHVHEEAADTLHIVLPPGPSKETEVLSDAELEAVSGGTGSSSKQNGENSPWWVGVGPYDDGFRPA